MVTQLKLINKMIKIQLSIIIRVHSQLNQLQGEISWRLHATLDAFCSARTSKHQKATYSKNCQIASCRIGYCYQSCGSSSLWSSFVYSTSTLIDSLIITPELKHANISIHSHGDDYKSHQSQAKKKYYKTIQITQFSRMRNSNLDSLASRGNRECE